MSHCPPLAVTSAVWRSSVEAREHVTCPGLHWTVKQQVAGTVILPQTSSKLTEIIILKRDYFKVASSLELFANQMKSVLMVRFQCKMFHFLKLLSQFRFSDWTMHLCLQRHCGRSQVRRWWQPLSSLADWLCARLGPLQGPELGLLEAEMSRVFGLGYSWPDTYSQCVFQTFLHDITTRWVPPPVPHIHHIPPVQTTLRQPTMWTPTIGQTRGHRWHRQGGGSRGSICTWTLWWLYTRGHGAPSPDWRLRPQIPGRGTRWTRSLAWAPNRE